MLNEEYKLSCRNLSQEDLNKKFLSTCVGENIDKTDDLDKIKYLLTSPDLKKHADINAGNNLGLKWACSNGNLDIVKYLINFPSTPENNIHLNNNKALKAACSGGNIDVVRYLLTTPHLKKYIDIHDDKDAALRCVCYNGHLEIVKYLLTSPELEEHANINAPQDKYDNMYDDCEDTMLIYACEGSNLEVIKYLLTSPELKEHSRIVNNNKNAFKYSFHNMSIVEYFIFDYGIELTEQLKQDIKDKPEIINLFKLRKLNEKLNNNLDTDSLLLTNRKSKL